MPLTNRNAKSLCLPGFRWAGMLLPQVLLLLGAATTYVNAEATTAQPGISQDEKLDSVLSITREIRKEVRPQNPFEDKSWGIELNPLSVLFANEALALYGGIQQFSWDRKAEWSFPFQFISNDDNKAFVLDAHYRFFLGEAQKGFYVSGFTRYAFLSQEYLNVDFESDNNFTDNRLGLGAGFGYRIYSKQGIYWGWSFSLGRYVIYDVPENYFDFLGLSPFSSFIFDIELFKFGFAF